MSEKKKKKSPTREWWDSVLFAVIAATLIRGLFLEAYTIPTPSMEKSLLVDDFLFVSKVHYGARTPKTILQVPLTHQKIWFTNIPSYLDWIQLPNYRLPGFTKIKNNDVVVFNYPGTPLRPDPYGGHAEYPVDLRTNYIKRCMGIPGDVLEVKDAVVYINGEKLPEVKGIQKYYDIEFNTNPNEKIFEKADVSVLARRGEGGKYFYRINATAEGLEEIKKYDFVTNVYPEILPKGDTSSIYGAAFPYNSRLFAFNRDNFGPITVPKKGEKIILDEKNAALYGSVIATFDLNKNAEFRDGKVFIDGQEVKEYTWKQDYYFMMGDNRYESDDSRFWGFVPEDHVVGKAAFIWMSIDRDASLFNKIRWKRLFNIIK
jgi:signal peptidase I